ncbi:MAG: hypothetical protein V7K17_03710 [Nostoc sp.]
MELKQLPKKLGFSRIKTRKQAAHRFRNADAGTCLEFIGGEFMCFVYSPGKVTVRGLGVFMINIGV